MLRMFWYHTDFGKEVAVDVDGKSSGDIATHLQELVKAGDAMPRCVFCTTSTTALCTPRFKTGLQRVRANCSVVGWLFLWL